MERSASGAEQILSKEFLAELRKLQIQMRRNSQQSISGQYRSAFRGSGMEFEEVREYVPGDEIRRIDWKVTARTQRPFVKSYREERELQVCIAVDVSPSTWTGTRVAFRRDILLKTLAALAAIALANGDKVGFLTFSSEVLRYRKPQKSKNIAWKMLHEIVSDEKSAQHVAPKTDLAAASLFLGNVLKRRSVIFLLSDFFAENYEDTLGGLCRRHDVTSVVVEDPADRELPRSGFTRLRDPESGETVLLNCSDPYLREEYRRIADQRISARQKAFQKIGLESLRLQTDGPFLQELIHFFHSRMDKKRHALAHERQRLHGQHT